MASILSQFSRRSLILGGSAAAAAGTVAATWKFSSADSFSQLLRPVGLGRDGVPLATANVDDWSRQVGSFFTAHTGHVFKLVDVQRFASHAGRPANLRSGAFVARFDVAKGGPLPRLDMFRLNHPKGGMFDVFMSPPDPRRPSRLLAVFN